ncbi:hypothetical protein Efla_007861 [Eimeria flavescens]
MTTRADGIGRGGNAFPHNNSLLLHRPQEPAAGLAADVVVSSEPPVIWSQELDVNITDRALDMGSLKHARWEKQEELYGFQTISFGAMTHPTSLFCAFSQQASRQEAAQAREQPQVLERFHAVSRAEDAKLFRETSTEVPRAEHPRELPGTPVVEGEDFSDYERLRDHMLHTRGLQYHPRAYLENLNTLRQAQYSALDLGVSLQELKKHYERAKIRQERFNNCVYPTLGTARWG